MLTCVLTGDIRSVQAALAAGQNVDGENEYQLPPIVAAAGTGNICMMDLLLSKGANVEAESPVGIRPGPPSYSLIASQGSRAIHSAAKCGHTDVLRMLLLADANPNAQDLEGRTALMFACVNEKERRAEKMVRVLLDGGAHPALANLEEGRIAIHFAAKYGYTGVIDMLLSKAPRTLTRVDAKGRSPLFCAALSNREGAVSFLLSARATCNTHVYCPLTIAARVGYENLVRILLSKVETIGGLDAFRRALEHATTMGQPKTLWILLGVSEERQYPDAQPRIDEVPLLHLAAGYGNLLTARVLHAAGADESARDCRGRIAGDIVGGYLCDGHQLNAAKRSAIRRTLERGAAFRARSWAWPVEAIVGAGVAGMATGHSGGGVGGTDQVRAPALAGAASLGVRIFRPKNKTFFANVVGRRVRTLMKDPEGDRMNQWGDSAFSTCDGPIGLTAASPRET